MKYIQEYRDKEVLKNILEKTRKLAGEFKSPVNIMEVCGTHTMAIGKYGIRKALSGYINLISGPGCPVCVCPDSYIDKAIEISKYQEVTIVSFGDMMKVPGSYSSLEKEKSKGRDIRVVYSPLDALKIAKENPERNIVFLAVGFETTVPSIAETVRIASREKIKNFYILSGHKVIPPAMEFLLQDKEIKIDGFLAPGHVSAIIGTIPYNFIPEKYGLSVVVSGFEPADILQSIYLLIKCSVSKTPSVINQYKRAVKEEGNKKAIKVIYDVFESTDSEWRGIGQINESGLKLKEKYSKFDADKKYCVKIKKKRKSSGCICGEILKGIKKPSDCKLFANKCTPENPVGPCMVSSEGTCAAYYKYERK